MHIHRGSAVMVLLKIISDIYYCLNAEGKCLNTRWRSNVLAGDFLCVDLSGVWMILFEER